MNHESRAPLRRQILTVAGVGAGIVALIALLTSGSDFGTLLSIFSTRFLGIFIEAVPFLLLGTFVSGLIEAFLTAEDIARVVPRNRVLATVVGTFMGFTFPVCECGVVPVVRRLYSKGLPLSVGVTFLLAAPVINPIVLASTAAAFGIGEVLIGRIIITIIVAFSIGLVFAVAARPQEVLRSAHLPVAPVMGGSGELPVMPLLSASPPRKSLPAGLRDAVSLAGDEFFEMGRYLIIGSMLAAAMQTFISQEFLLALGRGPIISVIAMQGLAFLLSVCSTVDSFLALAFAGTFTTGSVLAFLTFGPMVDIKSMLMFLGVFRRRIVLYLILLPLLMTLLIGIWINLNLAL
ncbi:MAG: permease [Anaerolineae bacterium]|nr:permease [Anaerolineae bacterium]